MKQGDRAPSSLDEAGLRERLEILQEAADNVRHGLCMFEADGRIAYCNSRYAEVIGLPAEKVHPGVTARELMAMAQEAGYYSTDQSLDELEKSFWRKLRKDLNTPGTFERNGRTYLIHSGQTASGKVVITLEDITTRLEAEDAIRRSEERLGAMLNAMPDCVKIFDEHGELKYINPSGLELVEAPDLTTLIDSGHIPLSHECLAESSEVHRRVIAGEPVTWTYEVIGMKGSRRHAEAHSVPFRLPDGTRANLSITRDVTSRMKAEAALRSSEERLLLAQEATGLADFEADAHGIIDASESLLRQLGLAPEARPMTFDELCEYIHLDDRKRVRDRVFRAQEERAAFEDEFRIIHQKTGEVRWIQASSKLVFNEDGEVARCIGAHLDITARKVAEQAVRESEERFRLAAEAAGMGIWDYDAAQDHREWSGRLHEILGLPPGEPANRFSSWKCLVPEDRERSRVQMQAIMAGHAERFEAVYRINRANDGCERWIAVNAWCINKGASPAERIIATVRDVTEEKTAEERIRWTANHDALTQLANRSLFQQELNHEIRSARKLGRSVGVMLLDLDHFKQINDSLGHDVGDALLEQFADRLRSAVRKSDTVARLGGDEFAIIVPDLAGPQDLIHLSGAIQERMGAPFIHDGRMLDCRVSAGATIFPCHGHTAIEMLKNADLALYAAKSAGRATLSVYDPEMRNDLLRQRLMIQQAREAIGGDRIIPYYQPKLELASGTVQGFEALLRWRMPNGRIGQPAGLGAAFDDLEIAAALSDRMIDRTIADMRNWLDRGIDFQHVAVNAAAAEFRRDDFAERVLESLRRNSIPTHCFQVEVTETVFVGRGAEYVHRALALLDSHGVKIALDDFGTGYASLSHLKQFPVDLIKIDQSFVRDMEVDPGDEAIVRAVINLGRSLGIHIVAEGIESVSQASRLQRLGCEFGQGFLFAKAVPASRVPSLIARWQDEGAESWNQLGGGDLRLVASQR